ncbi:MAG: MFS transporter, partial [Syntrophomonadaceae bacterium]|nr:MFS transporter [Syntrophomonadaceae bacterium]
LIAILGLTAFWLYEKRVLSPMLDFDLFKIKAFLYGNILGVFAYTSQVFITFLIPFYLERLLLFSPAYSGLLMTIPPITMALTAPIAGSLSDKYGPGRLTSISFLVLFCAHLLFSGLGDKVSIYYLIFSLFLAGMGMGLFGSPNNSSILGSIPPYKSGYAGGFISTIRNFCFSIGIALSASIFSYTLRLNEPTLDYAASYTAANQVVYLVGAGLTLTGLIISLLTKTSRSRESANLEPEKTQ